MSRIIRTMKSIKEIILLDLKNLTEYRFQLVSHILLLPFKVLIVYLLWSQIMRPMENQAVVSLNWLLLYYIILAFMEFVTTPYCMIAYELMSDVRSGNLDIYLTRPFHYLLYRYFDKSNHFLIFFIGMLLFTFVNGILPWEPYFWACIYFFIVSTLFLYLAFSFVGLCSFYFENILTFRDNLWNVIKLFAGSIVPLSFYPAGFKKVIEYLPFQYIYYKPISFVLNKSEPIQGDLVLSFAWLVIGIVLLNLFWRKSIQHYSSQGG